MEVKIEPSYWIKLFGHTHIFPHSQFNLWKEEGLIEPKENSVDGEMILTEKAIKSLFP